MKEEIKERVEMIARGEIPEGYKKTKVGIIPEDWEVKGLREVSNGGGKYGANSPATEYCPDLPRYLRITDINDNGKLIKINPVGVKIDNYEEFLLRENDLVFVRTGSTTGKTYLYNYDDGELVYAGFLIKFNINKELASSEFIKFQTETKNYWNWVQVMSARSGQPGINSKEYESLNIPQPELPEQQKIAQILSTWDKAIELKEGLIEEKEEQKKGLMQKLLTGEVRLDGFDGEWEEVRLGEVSDIGTGDKNNQDKIENGKYPFFVRSEKIERINSFSYDGEAILIPGDGRVGVIYHYINGKFDYHQRVYKISDFTEGLYGIYIYYYLKQFFKKQAFKYTAKATVDSLRMPMLTEMKILLPSLPEQKAIAKILSTADKELDLLKEELEQLKVQKKGLMQLLLTGIVRVKS